ncbi:uncharacterized protein LOC144422772 [Styela clava]
MKITAIFVVLLFKETANCAGFVGSTTTVERTYHQPEYCNKSSDGNLMPFVEVSYVSDGRKTNYSGNNMGFRIRYNFTRCIQGFIRSTISQCNGSEMIISNGTGHIQSPNYKNEYGKNASCT